MVTVQDSIKFYDKMTARSSEIDYLNDLRDLRNDSLSWGVFKTKYAIKQPKDNYLAKVRQTYNTFKASPRYNNRGIGLQNAYDGVVTPTPRRMVPILHSLLYLANNMVPLSRDADSSVLLHHIRESVANRRDRVFQVSMTDNPIVVLNEARTRVNVYFKPSHPIREQMEELMNAYIEEMGKLEQELEIAMDENDFDVVNELYAYFESTEDIQTHAYTLIGQGNLTLLQEFFEDYQLFESQWPAVPSQILWDGTLDKVPNSAGFFDKTILQILWTDDSSTTRIIRSLRTQNYISYPFPTPLDEIEENLREIVTIANGQSPKWLKAIFCCFYGTGFFRMV